MQGAARRRAAAAAWHSTNPSGLRAGPPPPCCKGRNRGCWEPRGRVHCRNTGAMLSRRMCRSEEHTSELQSQSNLVCRLLLEKKKTININQHIHVVFHNYDT